jgi:hypothetical protein
VSLEDRDWYREKPSEAWNERWRTTRTNDQSRNRQVLQGFMASTSYSYVPDQSVGHLQLSLPLGFIVLP